MQPQPQPNPKQPFSVNSPRTETRKRAGCKKRARLLNILSYLHDDLARSAILPLPTKKAVRQQVAPLLERCTNAEDNFASWDSQTLQLLDTLYQHGSSEMRAFALAASHYLRQIHRQASLH